MPINGRWHLLLLALAALSALVLVLTFIRGGRVATIADEPKGQRVTSHNQQGGITAGSIGSVHIGMNEDRQRQRILREIQIEYCNEYMVEHGDGIPSEVVMYTAEVPSEIVNAKLAKRGETWRI